MLSYTKRGGSLSKMKLYKFSDRLVLRFKNNASDFIKAYTTNTPEAAQNAFVNLEGRIVALCDQRKISDDEVLIVIEHKFLERLQKHLDKFLKITGCTFKKEATHVYFDLEGDFKTAAGEWEIPQNKGTLILTQKEPEANVSESDFMLFRLKNNIPRQGVDYDEELLLNVGNEAFVSYTKGCYFGQEIIARVHHRGRPPKKLAVKPEDELTPEEAGRMTSKSRDPVSGKVLGFVFLFSSLRPMR